MTRPLRVLFAEDDPADLELVLRELRQSGFTPDWQRVDTEAAFRTALSPALDIILSDFSMPQFSGLRALEVLQESGLEIPFILISGTVGEDTAVSSIHQGATDYVMKDRLARLGPAVSRALDEARGRRERRAAAQALRESEQRLRMQADMLDHIGQAVIATDLDGRIVFANRAVQELYGWSPEEILGRNVIEVTVPQMALDQAAQIMERLQRGDSWDGDFVVRHQSGRVFPVHVTNSPLLDDQRRMAGIIGISADISERKEAEESRRRADARFRRLVDSNAQGVIFRKMTGEITEANDAFLQMVGYSRDDLDAGGLNWVAMTPPEFADRDRHAMAEIAARGVCTPYEKEYRRKDGTRVPVLIGAASFEDNPQEGVAFVLDLTERKKLEQQFLRAQRMESIGTLAGGIAHDLNNVLGPIVLSLDLLKAQFPDPDSQELLHLVATSAQRGAEMVRQVLSFARGVESRRIAVPVKHLVQEIGKIANDTFLKHIQVRVVVPHDLWPVLGDPTQLHQVLMNLCVNARDAMPHGGTLTITADNRVVQAREVAASPDARPGPHVFLQVTDTGTGMAPTTVERIFDPFFTTKEPGKGTGLGLSTSLAIVKSHGGFIRVYSEPGQGTTFNVYLPAHTVPSADPVAEVEAALPRGNGELILVVDDEASVREITMQTLEIYGYRVLLAGDGAEAITIYREQKDEIAAVITDMMMPVLDGPATIQILKQINPDVVVIAVSGLGDAGQVSQATTLGVSSFLSKPYTAATMLNTLKTALRRGHTS